MFSQSEHNTLFTLCFQLSLCYTTLVSKGCAAFILTLISESHTHPLFKWYLTSRHFLLEISWDYGRDGASQMAPVVKNPLANAGDIKDTDLIPGLEKSPGGGHGNPLQYCCLENPLGQRTLVGTYHCVNIPGLIYPFFIEKWVNVEKCLWKNILIVFRFYLFTLSCASLNKCTHSLFLDKS